MSHSCKPVVLKHHTAMKKKDFRLTKICEKYRRDHLFVNFCMFPLHGNIIFSQPSFKRI